MILQSAILIVAILLQFSAAGTSFLALNSQRYREALDDATAASWPELASLGTSKEPLVCFRFTQFDLLTQLAQSSANTRFLPTFFEDSVTNVWIDDVPSTAVGAMYSPVVAVGQLPDSIVPSLYSQVDGEDAVVVFEFSEPSYDLERLDEYLETAYLFLEDTMANIDNLVVQVPTSGKSYVRDAADASEIGVSDPNKKPKPSVPADDTEILSTLWTEGLISCLIVAGFLLFVLVIAISWVTSIDISYGALEKPVNPLKKTN
ncbi:LADA_0H09604g1_1 [Lachancea dasiensis]|uniref:LADA_0H09604g1_1 n=1 Tax=Lachancea dasiensis TaxID=1072105 RepID=A0A1G4K2T7_9SACH|nr:LADA_0H09604g1_1 [Lachancea dasiensis]